MEAAVRSGEAIEHTLVTFIAFGLVERPLQLYLVEVLFSFFENGRLRFILRVRCSEQRCAVPMACGSHRLHEDD